MVSLLSLMLLVSFLRVFLLFLSGSSAGAGSGDFHVYRGVRRREYARQKFISELANKVGLCKKVTCLCSNVWKVTCLCYSLWEGCVTECGKVACLCCNVGRQHVCVTDCGKLACLCHCVWEGNMSVLKNVGR